MRYLLNGSVTSNLDLIENLTGLLPHTVSSFTTIPNTMRNIPDIVYEVGDVEYGLGVWNTKKEAKERAAAIAYQNLFAEMSGGMYAQTADTCSWRVKPTFGA